MAFVFGGIYLHQTFTECVSYQYAYFNVSICQIWLQAKERPLILFRFLGIFTHKCCISTKLSQIVYLMNINILIRHHARCYCTSGFLTYTGLKFNESLEKLYINNLILLCLKLGQKLFTDISRVSNVFALKLCLDSQALFKNRPTLHTDTNIIILKAQLSKKPPKNHPFSLNCHQ